MRHGGLGFRGRETSNVANDLTATGSGAGGSRLTPPAWVHRATADTRLSGEFHGGHALARLDLDERRQLGAACAAVEATLRPIAPEALRQRLTALGMSMAPNRAPAEATMWLHEFSRLLGDIPGDILCDAIDQLQRSLKFLPTVSEIRAIADKELNKRRRVFARLDAMGRYMESGKPIPAQKALEADAKPTVMDRRGERMNEAETAELNTILENLGACTRYRPDGSRYEVSKRTPQLVKHGEPQRPTRADYIAWGVDPEVLDRIEDAKHESGD